MGAEPSIRLEGKIPAGWLPLSHAEAINLIPELELIALCDNDEERLSRLSAHYKVKKIFTSYTELIDEMQPEFLCIATRTKGRVDIIQHASQKGVKIIYFEKPISSSIQACSDTLTIAKKNKVIMGYGVNRRYHAQYRKAKEIINSGIIGELKEIIIEHGLSNLYWSHPHSVDLILFYANCTDLEYLQATCTFIDNYTPSRINFIDNDPLVENAFFQFKNGIKASINQAIGLNTTLICTNGMLTVYADGSWIEIHRSDKNGYLNKSEVIDSIPEKSATVVAFEELLRCSLEEGVMPITPEEILAGMVMLNGMAYSSLSNGQRVFINDIPQEMIITGRNGNLYA